MALTNKEWGGFLTKLRTVGRGYPRSKGMSLPDPQLPACHRRPCPIHLWRCQWPWCWRENRQQNPPAFGLSPIPAIRGQLSGSSLTLSVAHLPDSSTYSTCNFCGHLSFKAGSTRLISTKTHTCTSKEKNNNQPTILENYILQDIYNYNNINEDIWSVIFM